MIRDYVCVDIETTGCKPTENKIIEIGAVKVRNRVVTQTFSMLIDPGIKVPPYITELTGITNEMVHGQTKIDEAMEAFVTFAGDDILMGHNLMFDYSFLKLNAMNCNLPFEKSGIDTLKIARKTLPHLESRALDYLCRYYQILDENHHRALNDATVTAQLYEILCGKFGADYQEVFEPQPLLCKMKKQQSATERQIKYLQDLIQYHGLDEPVDYENLTKSEASRKIDKILSEKGRIFGFENK